MSEKNKIGEKVRLVRQNRKLSIEDVSERTNLSVEQISSIENGSFVPNLTPLIKIARVLGVRLGTFMDDDENLGPVVARSGEKKEITRFSDRGNAVDSDLDFYTLAHNKAGRHMDPFIIEIFPSSEEEIKLSTHEGEEFLYVLEGEVEVKYGKNDYVLKAGDSIYYESIVAHHVHSYGNEKAKILAVVYTPA
ncbi:MAG: helix-turn-helix domain-containing protein [Treponemataceae bacterium]